MSSQGSPNFNSSDDENQENLISPEIRNKNEESIYKSVNESSKKQNKYGPSLNTSQFQSESKANGPIEDEVSPGVRSDNSPTNLNTPSTDFRLKIENAGSPPAPTLGFGGGLKLGGIGGLRAGAGSSGKKNRL